MEQLKLKELTLSQLGTDSSLMDRGWCYWAVQLMFLDNHETKEKTNLHCAHVERCNSRQMQLQLLKSLLMVSGKTKRRREALVRYITGRCGSISLHVLQAT
jgi:hypothetical protein